MFSLIVKIPEPASRFGWVKTSQLSHMEHCTHTPTVLGTDQSREEPGHVFETGCVLGNETCSFQAEQKEDFFPTDF